MNVLSIQSQVVYGHVGNGAAVPALSRLGFEVWAIPTVLLAHHPGHGRPAGRVLPAAEIAALVEGLAERGLLATCDGMLTGYLGSAENGAAALQAARLVRAANPEALVLCDPVMGDAGDGLYVPEAVARHLADQAVPAADVLTPNQFELGWLAGAPVGSRAAAVAACRRIIGRGPRLVVCTSLTVPEAPARIGTLAVTADGAWLAETPRIARPPPNGSGDVFAALLLAGLLKRRSVPEALSVAVSATYAVLAASEGEPEMRLIALQDRLCSPGEVFPAARLD